MNNNKQNKPSNKEILEELINKNIKKSEGDILSQYQLLVSSAEEISSQREKTNRYYFTLIAALFSVATFLSTYNTLFPIIALIFIILICVIWKKHLKEYKLLNSVKFSLINCLEEYLPIKAYNTEWKLLNNRGYNGLTNWNEKIPILIMFSSLIFIFGIIVLNFRESIILLLEKIISHIFMC